MENVMKEATIILRAVSHRTRGVFAGPLTFPADRALAGVEFKVDIDEVDRRQLSLLSSDSSVIGIAPVVPMMLVEPFDVRAAAMPLAGASVEWGVRAVKADSSPFTGAGAVVAVLDTGIDHTHPAFAGMTIEQVDFTGGGNGDTHGHGTHCAGTIFGRDVGGLRIGVARGVNKALIGKVIGPEGGGSDQIASAIQWALDNGANVISMSLGIDFPGLVAQWQTRMPVELATSRALEGYRATVQLFDRLAAFTRAQGAFGKVGILVAAAGNESDRDRHPDFEISVSPPAVAEGFVSVAALGEAANGLKVAGFSNTGANVAAPGVKVTSAKPGGGLQEMSGTSMATPHVAGVAALWIDKIKSTGALTEKQLTARLIGSCTQAGFRPGTDEMDVGAGLVQAPQS